MRPGLADIVSLATFSLIDVIRAVFLFFWKRQYVSPARAPSVSISVGNNPFLFRAVQALGSAPQMPTKVEFLELGLFVAFSVGTPRLSATCVQPSAEEMRSSEKQPHWDSRMQRIHLPSTI